MKKIIWVNGCFDILHVGHVELLKYAKSIGDILIVGIDTDERIRKLKGKQRPIIPLSDRKCIVESLEYVDHVVSFNSDDELRYHIKNNFVTTIVVGEEYKYSDVIGSEYSENIEYFKFKSGKSTSLIINKILGEYCKERFYNDI